MSDTIRSVFLSYIVCSVLGGVLQYLSPDKMKKTLRSIIVGVILFSSVLPLTKGEISLNKPDFTQHYEQEELNSLMHTANLLERKIYKQTEEILIKLGIDEYEIYITANPSTADNTVYLERYYIEIEEKHRNKTDALRSKIPDEYKSILEIGVKNE